MRIYHNLSIFMIYEGQYEYNRDGKMNLRTKKGIAGIAVATAFFSAVPTEGFCDCLHLDSDMEWSRGMNEVKKNYDNKSYDKSLETARKLYKKCDQSPMLNYYVALNLRAKDEMSKALQYIQKASDLTMEVSVSPAAAKAIYDARYEMEHPERTESAILAQKALYEQVSGERDDYRAALESARLKLSQDLSFQAEEARRQFGQVMWTGAGVGIAGVVLTAVGASLGATADNTTGDGRQISMGYLAGWTMFGAGLGMVAAGAIVAGIAGYRYTHVENSVGYAFEIAPNRAAFSLQF